MGQQEIARNGYGDDSGPSGKWSDGCPVQDIQCLPYAGFLVQKFLMHFKGFV